MEEDSDRQDDRRRQKDYRREPRVCGTGINFSFHDTGTAKPSRLVCYDGVTVDVDHFSTSTPGETKIGPHAVCGCVCVYIYVFV